MYSSKSKNTPNARLVDGENLEGRKGSNTILQLKNLRKAAYQRKPGHDVRGCSQIYSQGGDGSGITSAKDMSSMTSAKRLREPLPCQGRKELINLVQESMMNPKNEVRHVPAPLRKRVIASQTADKQFINLTPMPLQSRGVPISRTVRMKNKGPCAGTKGFRAPEVRSAWFLCTSLNLWHIEIFIFLGSLVQKEKGKKEKCGSRTVICAGLVKISISVYKGWYLVSWCHSTLPNHWQGTLWWWSWTVRTRVTWNNLSNLVLPPINTILQWQEHKRNCHV